MVKARRHASQTALRGHSSTRIACFILVIVDSLVEASDHGCTVRPHLCLVLARGGYAIYGALCPRSRGRLPTEIACCTTGKALCGKQPSTSTRDTVLTQTWTTMTRPKVPPGSLDSHMRVWRSAWADMVLRRAAAAHSTSLRELQEEKTKGTSSVIHVGTSCTTASGSYMHTNAITAPVAHRRRAFMAFNILPIASLIMLAYAANPSCFAGSSLGSLNRDQQEMAHRPH